MRAPLIGCGLSVLMALGARPAPLSDEEQALRILRLANLKYTWVPSARVTADLTGDGVVEVAVPGASATQVAVGIIRGPVGPLSKMFVLSWAADLLGRPSCARSMKVETEDPRLPPDLWGCGAEDQSFFCRDNRELAGSLAAAAGRGTRAVVLRGEGCHTVHAYWDGRTEQIGWWRELPP